MLPADVRPLFNVEKDGTIVMSGQFFDSPSDLGRQAAYKVYYAPDRQQEALLYQLLEQRQQLSQLCGYTSWSERAVSHSLAQSPDNIHTFNNLLAAQLPPRLSREYEVMSEMKARLPGSGSQLAPWDVPYISAMAKHTWFKIDLEKNTSDFSQGRS